MTPVLHCPKCGHSARAHRPPVPCRATRCGCTAFVSSPVNYVDRVGHERVKWVFRLWIRGESQ